MQEHSNVTRVQLIRYTLSHNYCTLQLEHAVTVSVNGALAIHQQHVHTRKLTPVLHSTQLLCIYRYAG
jgi:hypothetical protein